MKKIKKGKDLQEEELYSRIEIQERSLQMYIKEIYENIGQVLSLARLQLLSLDPGERSTLQKARNSGNLVGKAINDLRSLTKQLFPEEIIQKGFAEAVGTELKRLENAGLCNAHFLVSGNFFSLEEVKELVVFCVMQELIHPFLNKQVPGKINVSVFYEKDSVLINFEARTDTGQRLMQPNDHVKLEERLRLIDGTLLYQDKPTEGLKIIIKK